MVKFNYTRARTTANRLIEKFGARGAVMRFTKGNPKPTYAAVPVQLVVMDFSKIEVDGTRIRAEDKKILVSPVGLSFEIDTNDRIRDAAGNIYEIVPPVKPFNPGGSVIVYYEIQGRR